MIGWKTALYFAAVALIEIWKAENTFSIRTKPHLTATASFPWGCVNMGFLLARTVKNKMLIFVVKIFDCSQDDSLSVMVSVFSLR